MCNLHPPFDADSVLLIDGQRVVAWFDREKRRQSRRARLNGKLQMDRVRVSPDIAAKPAEVGWI